MARAPEMSYCVPEDNDSLSIEDMDYYDIMILGLTGQGKTATANKLLIANPSGKRYEKINLSTSRATVVSSVEAKMEDISMWLIPNDANSVERISVRLLNLAYFRLLESPHLEINAAYDSEMNIYRKTQTCELFSNETTKVRVLDVPGFFGSITATQLNSLSTTNVSQEINSTHLAIMRSILHSQTMMKMRFKRILYFLPCRGALNVASAALQQELELLTYYFGRHIFDSIVLVATLDSVTYQISDNVQFPQEMLDKSRRNFQEVLESFVPEDTPNPPIIFISLKETCESILQKIKATRVIKDDLRLELSPSLCSQCGVTIGERNRERVAVVKRYGWLQQMRAGPGWNEAMPYDHSKCHPVFVPRYSLGGKLTEGLSYVVRALVHLEWNWPDLNVEKCQKCNNPPGTEGCMLVGSLYKGKKVDHTNQVENSEHQYFNMGYRNTSSSSSVPSQSDASRKSVSEMEDDSVFDEINPPVYPGRLLEDEMVQMDGGYSLISDESSGPPEEREIEAEPIN